MSAVSKARDTLLRALDQLDKAEADLEAEPDRVELIVVYSVGCEDPENEGAYHEVGGWASTSGPKWMFAALLERGAIAFREEPAALDDPSDDEEEDQNA